ITKVKDLIIANIGEQAIVRVEEEHLQPILVLQAESLVEIAFLLRDTAEYYFDFLSNISAVDYHLMRGLLWCITWLLFLTKPNLHSRWRWRTIAGRIICRRCPLWLPYGGQLNGMSAKHST